MQTQHPYNEESNSETLSLIGRIFQHATSAPDHEAIVTPGYTLSYSQLAELISNQAVSLTQLGISESTVVGINCENDIEHLLLCLASTYIGATSCTIPSYERPEVQQSVIQKCNVTHVLEHAIAFNNSEKPISDTPTPSSTSKSARLLFSTSGSTGEPKLVIHHDSDIVAQAHRHIDSTQERFACRATVEHNFAKRHRLYCFAVGATNIFLGEKLENVVEGCLSLKVNVLHVSAFQAQELMHLPNIGQLSNIRLKLGGSHVPLSLRKSLQENITPTVQAGYGTTETGAIAFTDPKDTGKNESVGHALSGIEIRCVDAQRNPVPTGEKGEVAIRCDGLFRGYLNQTELTNKKLNNGWFYTGDIAYLDEQNRIHLSGRLDDMFTFNSMNIYPQEIESVIKQFPDIVDAVVAPKPSASHGNIPVALVVFNPGMRPNLSALKHFVEKQTGHRSPKKYVLVDKIPKTKSGKVSRLDISTLSERSDQIRKALIEAIDIKTIEKLRASQIKDFIEGKRDLSFRKIGLDSLARMNLLVSIEVNFDIVISPQELARFRTLGKLASKLVSQPDESHDAYSQQITNTSFEQFERPGSNLPFIVRFLKRLSHYCDTVAEFNQVLAKLEDRLTPLDIAYIDHAHNTQQLLTKNMPKKYQHALTLWINEIKTLMFSSGKKKAELFISKRITPNITLFSSKHQDRSKDKTLLIAFPPRGVKNFMMPNAVLLQHIDASQHDLLMITPEKNGGYQFGTIPFGRKLSKQASWLQHQPWFLEYPKIRTFGFSAGSFPAIALGYLLNAEVALSIAGRFHRKKHILINIDKIFTTWRVKNKGKCNNILVSYSAHNRRDGQFAAFISKACNAKKIEVEISTERLPHLMLRRLVERGELAEYLSRTLFIATGDATLTSSDLYTSIKLPLKN